MSPKRAGGRTGFGHALLLTLALVALLVGSSVAAGQTAGSGSTGGADPTEPQPSLTSEEAIEIADTSGKARDWNSDHSITRKAAQLEKDEDRWKVSFMSENSSGTEKVESQVFIDDDTGEIEEVRTGPQVGWMMARGYDGAFGREINRPVIWLSLSAIFLLPLLTPRRLFSIRTLDLLVLLSFGVSLIWFNRGEIFTSVPLVYPPLAYLALRLTWIGLGRRAPRPRWLDRRRAQEPEPAPRAEEPAPSPGRFSSRIPQAVTLCPPWLLTALLAIVLAVRYGLNAFDSNVIDVGYAGVIGADRILDGRAPYGEFPSDCGHCDTYGPLNYIAYVPFVWTQPWSGEWDTLPAAHGAASAFDILAVVGMGVLGWQLGGNRLGLLMALAWAAFPFTAYALETNSNDTLVAATLIWGMVLARHAVGRGVMVSLAVAAKIAPALLLPLWSRHPFPDATPRHQLPRYLGGLAVGLLLVFWAVALDGLRGITAFPERTVLYQIGRDSPFSIWGQNPELRPLQLALIGIVALAGLAVLRWPRRLDLLGAAALSGALIVGFEMTLTHWFYLYIPWFLPFALLAFVPVWQRPARPEATAPETPATERKPTEPAEARELVEA